MQERREQGALRLLFLGSDWRWGDVERWMVQVASGLAGRGHRALVAAPGEAQLLARAGECGLPTRGMARVGTRALRRLWGTATLILRERPDAILVDRGHALRDVCLTGLVGPRRAGFGHRLIFVRDESNGSRSPDGWLEDLVRRRITRVLTATRPDASGSGTMIHNGVIVPEHREEPDPKKLRRELRLPRKPPLVVHVGELAPGHAQETTLRAMAAIRARRAAQSDEGLLPVAVFVGTGPDEARLHVLSHELGIKDQVVWVGFHADPSRFFDVADLVVFPGRRASVPWTLLEAMARACPVVATRSEAVPEVMEDGETGLVIPVADSAALADAVERLLADEALGTRLTVCAQGTVRKAWRLDHTLTDLERLLYSHLRGRSLDRRASCQEP